MKSNFWSLIWSSILEIGLGLLTFIAGIFVLVTITRFSVKTPISLGWFILAVLFLLGIIAILGNALYKISIEYRELEQRITQQLIPKILSAKKYNILERAGILCLLNQSELFSIGILISCYYRDNEGFEFLIGTGQVINIQEDGKIQALVDLPVSAYQDILNKLANNDSQVINRILVKPTIRNVE